MSFESNLYRWGVRPPLFSATALRPEWAHSLSTPILRGASLMPGLEGRVLGREHYTVAHPGLGQTVCGVFFPNPLGVAAGEDKNYKRMRGWYRFGAGWEVGGTTTFHRRAGNKGKRIWRYSDGSLMNALGFNNLGLGRFLEFAGPWDNPWYGRKPDMPLIGSFSISADTRAELVELELRALVAYLHPYFDILEFNPASPNTPGLRVLLDKDRLPMILAIIQDQIRLLGPKPLWVKVDPDRTNQQYADILQACIEHGVTVIVATNTSNNKEIIGWRRGKGGASGPPLEEPSNQVLYFLYTEAAGQMPFVGTGGTGRDLGSVLRKFGSGGTLIGVNSALHECGWPLFRDRNRELTAFMDQNGVKTIAELVGQEELRKITV